MQQVLDITIHRKMILLAGFPPALDRYLTNKLSTHENKTGIHLHSRIAIFK